MRIILKDGSGVVTLKFLTEDVDRHCNVRVYFRRNGHKIRLRSVLGTQPFLDEYRKAIESTGKQRPSKVAALGSFKSLVDEYLKSGTFRRLDESTRTMRERHLNGMIPKHGDNVVAIMEPRHVRAIIEEHADTPHAANNRLKTLRRFFVWCIGAGHVNRNPARDVEKFHAPSEGHHPWTMDELLQFMEKHAADTKAGLAIALFYYTGVRISDVVKLGRQMESKDGSIIKLVEIKGRSQKVKVTEIAVNPELRAVLDLHKSDRLTYLKTVHGKPHSVKGFGNWFKKQCVAAGVGHCSAHGVRKGGATIAADRGATPHQLQAMYGWATLQQPSHYTKTSNRRKLGAEGFSLLTLGNRK